MLDKKKKKKGREKEGEDERKIEDDEAAPNHRKARVLVARVQKGELWLGDFLGLGNIDKFTAGM